MSFNTARKKAGLSNAEVARRLGLTRAAVDLWDRGKGLPPAKRLLTLAEMFGCTVDELLKED